MIIEKLYKVQIDYTAMIADQQLSLLQKQKFGYSFSETFNMTEPIINSIILDALVKANSFIKITDQVRIPTWTDCNSFDRFISKVSSNG